MNVTKDSAKLVAIADINPEATKARLSSLVQEFGEGVNVPPERQFYGFDAYKQAMDCLGPGDIVICATPPAFRWVNYRYAIEKGLHVFLEKPVCVDAPTARRMLTLNEEAKKKGLKVAVGLMCRHCRARYELLDRIRSGEIGDILMMRAYRMQAFSNDVVKFAEAGVNELVYQVRHFRCFLWTGGGTYNDNFIHNIDECCWMKGDWPIKAHALGGRHYRGDAADQNLDTYSVEYTFPDGAKLFLDGRIMPGCYEEFSSYANGTKRLAVISTYKHTPAKCRIYKAQLPEKNDLLWSVKQPEQNPYNLEWVDYFDAIRQDKPYNEVERSIQVNRVAIMGRMAAHTGRIITYDEILKNEHEFAPNVDKLTMETPAPLQVGPDGKYPVPQPGILTDREY